MNNKASVQTEAVEKLIEISANEFFKGKDKSHATPIAYSELVWLMRNLLAAPLASPSTSVPIETHSGLEVLTSDASKLTAEHKFEALKNKGGTFDIFIDKVNLGVFDVMDGKMVYFPKRNEKITGDHYMLIGQELNKINTSTSRNCCI